VKQFRMWFKCRFLMGGGEPIPRTHVLANIASKYPVFHMSFKSFRDVPFFLDGGIGDTLTPIQEVTFLIDAISSTGIDSTPVGSAIILNLLVMCQFYIEQYLAPKEI